MDFCWSSAVCSCTWCKWISQFSSRLSLSTQLSHHEQWTGLSNLPSISPSESTLRDPETTNIIYKFGPPNATKAIIRVGISIFITSRKVLEGNLAINLKKYIFWHHFGSILYNVEPMNVATYMNPSFSIAIPSVTNSGSSEPFLKYSLIHTAAIA